MVIVTGRCPATISASAWSASAEEGVAVVVVGSEATLQSAQLSQHTVLRRGAPSKNSTPALIHLRWAGTSVGDLMLLAGKGRCDEGGWKTSRRPAWSNWVA